MALEGWTHWTVAFGTARGDVVVSTRQELYQLCNLPPIMSQLLLPCWLNLRNLIAGSGNAGSYVNHWWCCVFWSNFTPVVRVCTHHVLVVRSLSITTPRPSLVELRLRAACIMKKFDVILFLSVTLCTTEIVLTTSLTRRWNRHTLYDRDCPNDFANKALE